MSFNNETLNWDDLRLFLAVAESGGLAQAAGVSGSSAPTLSRRMTHLEGALGVTLFTRQQSGYVLTQQGLELLSRVEAMQEQSRSIGTWLSQLDPRPVVRVASGTWTSVFLARHFAQIVNAEQGPRVELVSGATFVNLSRRDADIAIRNRKPEQQGLARKRLGSVDFAIYGAPAYCRAHPAALGEARYSECEWVGLGDSGTGASSQWLQRNVGGRIRLLADSPHAMLEAAANGAGLCVLPCFIGSADKRLKKCSVAIEGLRHTQWMATHNDGRKLSHVRKLSLVISKLFAENQEVSGRSGNSST